MTDTHTTSASSGADDRCWTRRGILGDGTCEKLADYIHCQNCPDYEHAAVQLFERPAPAEYIQEWTLHLAQQKEPPPEHAFSAVLFRIAGEWLSFSTHIVSEITEDSPVHSLPHKQSPVLKGIVNVHGKVQPCFSLGRLLEIDPNETPDSDIPAKIYRRLIITALDNDTWIFPVDEILGVYRFQSSEAEALPATVGQAERSFASALLYRENRKIGLLDHELILSALKRSLG